MVVQIDGRNVPLHAILPQVAAFQAKISEALPAPGSL